VNGGLKENTHADGIKKDICKLDLRSAESAMKLCFAATASSKIEIVVNFWLPSLISDIGFIHLIQNKSENQYRIISSFSAEIVFRFVFLTT